MTKTKTKNLLDKKYQCLKPLAKSKPSNKAVLKGSACLSLLPKKKENKPWSLLYSKQNSKPILVLTQVNLMGSCFSNEPLSLTKHRPAFIYIRLTSAIFWIEDWEVNVEMQAKLIIFINRLKNCWRFLQLMQFRKLMRVANVYILQVNISIFIV